MDRYLIYDNCLCRKTERGLKHYVNLSKYSDSTRNEIVDTLNNNLNDLTIIKKPALKKLSFYIKDKPFLEHWWVNEFHDYTVALYILPKQEDSIVIPARTSEHHYLNIFNEMEITEAWPDEYYVIKCDTSKGIYIVDKNNHILHTIGHIFETFNIFEGKHIVVDVDSFLNGGYVMDSGLIDLDAIRRAITGKYRVSYVKKILIKKNLLSKDLRHFVEKCHCAVHSVWADQEHKNFMFFVVDNLGDHYELNVLFDDANHQSEFKFVKKVPKTC